MTPTNPAQWPYPLTAWRRPLHYNDLSPAEPLVRENAFVGRMPDRAHVKTFAESRPHLPTPFWEGHPTVIEGYWHAWDLAFRNCRRAPLQTGFITPFIDTAFNDCLFMWDSVFILMFARYGERAFPFQKTLDNFYAKQHASGFISREIREWNGEDHFHYADPNSTGPNVLPWSEWEYFQQFGDRERLAAVFPPLLAYYRWFRRNRTWQDGTYWATGWACGMDNQPRLSPDANPKWSHDHLSWIGHHRAGRLRCKSPRPHGRSPRARERRGRPAAGDRAAHRYIRTRMWNEEQGIYVDRRRDGSLSQVKSIAGFWPLLAGIAPDEHREKLLAHLTNPATFGRPHPVPSLSADDPHYQGETGKYWLGGVWPSTNYMVLRALTDNGADALAHTLGCRHLEHVTNVFLQTGTYWENYAPESSHQGTPAQKDFVGWGGVGPIAVLLEYVLGLRPDFFARRARLGRASHRRSRSGQLSFWQGRHARPAGRRPRQRPRRTGAYRQDQSSRDAGPALGGRHAHGGIASREMMYLA